MDTGIRKMVVVGMVAVLLFMASCKKNGNNGDNNDGNGFTAIIEQDGGNGKTHLDGVVVKWTAYDQIKVANYGGGSGSTTLTYELTEGAGTSQGVFYTGEDHADFFHPDYVAAYPAAKVTSISGTKVTFNLLKTQTLGKNSFGEGCNPMVAYSSNQTLQFKNVLGALCFRFRGVEKIGSLRLTSKDPADKLWGTCEVTVGSDGVPTSTMITNTVADQHIITLSCNGIELSPTTDSLFYIMLPPGTLASGFTLEVLDENGTVFYSHDGSIGTSTEYPEGYIVRNRVIKPSNHLYLKVGAICAPFSVSATKKVYFSKGNLQYTKSTSVWAFMEHQYDIVETNGMKVGDNYTSQGIVGLFCWGTSGYHDSGDVGNTYYHPYSTHKDAISNENNWYGYGPSTNMTPPNLVGSSANYDWGVNNAISNGGNASGQWRTLTIDEWDYVLNDRAASTVAGTPNACYVKATVNDVTGLILFPDSYTHPAGVAGPANIGENNVLFSVNNYGSADWLAMEAAGAIFLPAAGFRQGTSVGASVGAQGYYSSTTYHDRSLSRILFFDGTTDGDAPNVTIAVPSARCNGFSVRLVHDIQ